MVGLIVDVAIIIILGSAVILLAWSMREEYTRVRRLELRIERSVGTKFKVDNMESRVQMLERDSARVQRALRQHDMEADDGK